MTTVYIKVESNDFPNPQIIKHWLTYPDSDTPEDQRAMRLIDIKRFLTCFGVAMEDKGFNSEDLVGCTGECLVIQEEADNGNTYNRLRLPRLKKASTGGGVVQNEEGRRRRR
jgi:hypothetical protein